ncbi:hypothetical protein PENTCL1PPCAC_2050 [Pristionchus entomophagus]|uniref:RING-type domain-containing protein n=1 Tax=Pristionchus entomophagus TaxID=358040 RepID=A0AAV5SI81_9BILA|nr:hypothetical protein PENTCL1PPCAC_2050 [Pristionchus entomophagus]
MEEAEREEPSFLLSIVDAYADLCDYLLSSVVDSAKTVTMSLNSIIINATTFIVNVLWIPVRIASFLFTLASYILFAFTIPARICFNAAANFPIITILFVLTSLTLLYLIKRITQQNFIQWLLYTAIPYIASIAFTVLGIFVPQVNTLVNIVNHLSHPIQWILDLIATIRRRAAAVTRTVSVLSPRRDTNPAAGSIRRSPRLSVSSNSSVAGSPSTLDCVICLTNRKDILFRPCNHMAVCKDCLPSLMDEDEPLCPLCRAEIDSHFQVYY